MTVSEAKQDGQYKKVSALVDDWLSLHKGERFDLDLICRQLEISERENRNLITIKLAYEVKHGNLEKNNKYYSVIDKTIKYIDWVNASEHDILDIHWPRGHESETKGILEDSHFGFDGHVVVSPGDVLVVAGNSNAGKTCFVLNTLWENMDNYPCRLMGNEYVAPKFKRRVGRMKWANPLKEDGTPKFELIERREAWHQIIEPDSINIIDWIQLGDEFYQIGTIIDRIQGRLRKGIALIVLQKSEGKTLGRGGSFSEDLSSFYVSIDFERLTVVKCKEWKDHNPNNEMYGFTIVDYGTKFHNIRPVQKCPKCYGRGFIAGAKCQSCLGKGYADKEEK